MPNRLTDQPDATSTSKLEGVLTGKSLWTIVTGLITLGTILVAITGYLYNIDSKADKNTSRMQMYELERDMRIKQRDTEYSGLANRMKSIEDRQQAADANANEIKVSLARVLAILERLDPKK